MQPPTVAPEHLFLVHVFDVLAAIVFAVSGALVASASLDVMPFMWFAVITGVGGGRKSDRKDSGRA